MKNFLLVVLVVFSSSAYAGINKWVDENNQVHYSDQPPPGNAITQETLSTQIQNESESSNKKQSDNDGESEEPKTIAEREVELRKARKEKQEAADKAAAELANLKINQANCNNARKSLKSLQSGIRMMDTDENGELFYLNDAQRQQRISETQKDISGLCK